MSPVCLCGAVKVVGEMLCRQCEWEEQDELAELNPPSNIDTNYE